MGEKAKSKDGKASADIVAQQQADKAQREHNRPIVVGLLGGKTKAADVAVVIRAHPRYEMDFFDFLNEHGGNAFVMSVYDELDKLDAAAPAPTDAVSDVRGLSELNSVPAKAQPATMPVEDKRSARLPYDGRGGWNGAEINMRVGQYDNMPGTDNDDDRCAFATILAAKVFDGPQVFGSWLSSFKSRHGGSGVLMNPKQSAANHVIEAVAKAIKDGTATYRDLSWLQEALYDYSVSALNTDAFHTKEGVDSTADVLTSETDTVGPGGGECKSAADVVKGVKTLAKGTNMMVEWTAAPPGGKQFRHEMMISNNAGKTYLYDASGTIDGVYLHELTAAAIAPYFEEARFKDSKMKLASTLTSKAGVATD